MNDLILIEIRDLLKKLVEMQSGNTSIPAEEKGEKAPDIMSWIQEKNELVVENEAPEETEEKEEEVIFTLLSGVDPSGLEDYIGKPLSEVDKGIISMISRPDYATRFAPQKFPQEVIDACLKMAE